MFAYVGSIQNLKDLKDGGSLKNLKDLKEIRKDAGLCCGYHLRKGEVIAYVGCIHNLKDLKDPPLQTLVFV